MMNYNHPHSSGYDMVNIRGDFPSPQTFSAQHFPCRVRGTRSSSSRRRSVIVPGEAVWRMLKGGIMGKTMG